MDIDFTKPWQFGDLKIACAKTDDSETFHKMDIDFTKPWQFEDLIIACAKTDDSETNDSEIDDSETDDSETDEGEANGEANEGDTEGGKTDGGRTDGGEANEKETNGGKTDGRKPTEGEANEWKTDEGKTDEGENDEGQTDEGKTDEGGPNDGGGNEGEAIERGTDEEKTDEGGANEGGANRGGADGGIANRREDNKRGKYHAKANRGKKVYDTILYANKATMQMWSPVFSAMLKEGTFQEGVTQEVKLPGKKFEHVLELLRVLHPPSKPVTMLNVQSLLPLAQEFLIDRVMGYCDTAMASETPNMRTLELADVYNLPKTREKCITELAKTSFSNKIYYDTDYKSLIEKSKIELLEKRVEILEKEYFQLSRDIANKRCSHNWYSGGDMSKLDTQCESCMYRLLQQSVLREQLFNRLW